MPVRRPPAGETEDVALTELSEFVSGETRLGDPTAAERWGPSLNRCPIRTLQGAEGQLALRVNTAGTITYVAAGQLPVDQCLANALRSRTLTPGKERIFAASFSVPPANHPFLTSAIAGVPEAPHTVENALHE